MAIAVAELVERLQGARHPGKVARAALQETQAQLDAAFGSTPIRDLVAQRAAAMDNVLSAVWQFSEFTEVPDIALVAVGGYGRGELHPHSDVDILVLCEQPPEGLLKEQLERFITLLWDIGLEIGHSVRTLDEGVALARSDITIATNIMEMRTLCGPDQLREKLLQLTSPQHMWPAEAFFNAKREEQIARHRKFGFTEYSLEPDIKNAPGGLRDLQTIAWIAKRHFGLNSWEELLKQGFIDQPEFTRIRKCEDYLWQIRWILHRLNNRNENRLLFDYQREVARQLGYEDDDGNLAVEQCMKRYYRMAMAISVLNEVLLQAFDEQILQSQRQPDIQPINRRFQLNNGYLDLTGDHIFARYPSALLEGFVILAQHPEIRGLRASYARLLMRNRKKIDEAFRHDSRNTSLFMELLRSPHGLFSQLRRMKRFGILGQYLPEFGAVIGLMQYDLFHIYTVDYHTLMVVRHMRRLRYHESRETLPLAYEVFYRLPKPELLYISGLYHDIAKGRGGDHSTLGAVDAMAFCKRHGLSSWDSKLVAWLVENHLLMSVTAQRKDISDPDEVMDFARKVGDLVHLDYLYTLTVADINATNPSLWNAWRASLLRQLYRETRRVLRRGLSNPPDKQDWIDETRQAALAILKQQRVHAADAETLWAGLGEDYFLRETPRDIAWHTEAILNRENPKAPLVLIRASNASQFEGGTQIFIYTPDQENLFATMVNALDQQGLTILDARIITSSDGFTLDTYIVMDQQGTPIADDLERQHSIREEMTAAFTNPSRFSEILQRRLPRRHRHFDVPTQVMISNDIQQDHTSVEIITLDRPGLLAQIGKIFAEEKLRVHNARIATLGERVEDVFFITDQQGEPLRDMATCEALQKRLITELDDIKESLIV